MKFIKNNLILVFLFCVVGCYSIDDGSTNADKSNDTDSAKADDTESSSTGTDNPKDTNTEETKEGCEYNGKFYNPGDSFDAEDGCNSCSCESTICEDCQYQVMCTQMACITDPCKSLTEIECTNNNLCAPIMGRKIEKDSIDCYSDFEPQFTGCMSAETGCDAAEAYAKDIDDTCWLFASACLPSTEGWKYNNDGCWIFCNPHPTIK